MIKVNLNKTKSSVTLNTQSTGLASSGSTVFTKIKTVVSERGADFSIALLIRFIINIVLISCFPLGLKFYEIQQINKLGAEKDQEDSLMMETRDRFATLMAEIKSYDHLKKKSEEFTHKRKFLQELAEARLTVPRIIDLIQNKIPKTVWLEELKLKVSKEKNELEISGKSFSEAHVNVFASSLHDILDKNSITVNTQDIAEGGNKMVRVAFVLSGRK